MSTSVIESHPTRDQRASSLTIEQTDDAWKPLYRMAAVAALILIARRFFQLGGAARR